MHTKGSGQDIRCVAWQFGLPASSVQSRQTSPFASRYESTIAQGYGGCHATHVYTKGGHQEIQCHADQFGKQHPKGPRTKKEGTGKEKCSDGGNDGQEKEGQRSSKGFQEQEEKTRWKRSSKGFLEQEQKMAGPPLHGDRGGQGHWGDQGDRGDWGDWGDHVPKQQTVWGETKQKSTDRRNVCVAIGMEDRTQKESGGYQRWSSRYVLHFTQWSKMSIVGRSETIFKPARVCQQESKGGQDEACFVRRGIAWRGVVRR